MPYWRFQIANFSLGLVWSAVLLLFGDGLSHDRRMAVAAGVRPGNNPRVRVLTADVPQSAAVQLATHQTLVDTSAGTGCRAVMLHGRTRMDLSRRHALAGAAALAASPLLARLRESRRAAGRQAGAELLSLQGRRYPGERDLRRRQHLSAGRHFRAQRQEGRGQRRARQGLHAEGQDDHPFRAAGDQHRRQAGRHRHRQRRRRLRGHARAMSASSPTTWPPPASIPRTSTWW